MKPGRSQLARLVLIAAVIVVGAVTQATAAHAPAPGATAAFTIIPPSGYGYRAAPEQTRTVDTTTAKLLHLLHLDATAGYSFNLVTRAAVFSSTGLLALWFVVGGIPRRRSSLPLVSLQPVAQRTTRVLETLSHRLRSNTFQYAYGTQGSLAKATELPHEDSRRAIHRAYEPPHLTASTATILELMSHGGEQKNHHEHGSMETLDATSRVTQSDGQILAEVEEYARELLHPVSAATPPVETASMTTAPSEPVAAPIDIPEPEPSLAAESQSAVEMESESIPVDTPEPTTMATQPRRIDDDDVLGLAELASMNVSNNQALAIDELFSAVENVAEATVDPYDLMQCEIMPLPERPYRPDEIATILKPEMITNTILCPAATQRPACAPPVIAAEPGPLVDQRIIIIGDSEAVLEVEKRIVISAGARVITFLRFGEAVNFADEKDFDLMVVNGMTEDGFSAIKIHDWLVVNRPGWERRSAFALSAPDPNSDDFASRTGAWCIVHPFGPKELVGFLRAVVLSTQLAPM